MFKLKVENFMAIREAEVEFGPGLTLLVGANGSGKSSLLRAAAACMCPDSIIPIVGEDGRGLVQKGKSGEMVNRAATKATATMTADGESVTVSWPANKYTGGLTVGRTGPIQAGMVSWMAMPVDWRRQALTGILHINGQSIVPTSDDLMAELVQAGISDEIARQVMAIVSFDAANSMAEREAADLKGQWKSATGEQWGEIKAQRWMPPGYDPAWKERDLVADVERLKKAVEDGIGRLAVSADHVARLRMDAGKEKIDVAAIQVRVDELQCELEAIQSQPAKLPDALLGEIRDLDSEIKVLGDEIRALQSGFKEPIQEKKSQFFPCPACKATLASDVTGAVALADQSIIDEIEKHNRYAEATNPVIVGENAEIQKKIRLLSAMIGMKTARMKELDSESKRQINEANDEREKQSRNKTVQINIAKSEIIKAERSNKAIEEAVTKLEAIQADTTKTMTQDRLAELKQEHANAVACLDLWRAKYKADYYDKQIREWLKVKTIVEPSGLRAKKLRAGMGFIQGRLDEICHVAGWKQITINDAMDLSYDGYPHYLLSPGCQLRCRYAMQFLFSILDGKTPVLLDEFGVMDGAGRIGVVDIVKFFGLTVLAACKESHDFARKVRDGCFAVNVYWIDKGAAVLV